MKKTYIIPQITVEVLAQETMLATSQFHVGDNNQFISPTDDPYDDEFCAKGDSYGESIFDE